jgi:putative oxidoreductase
MEELRLLGRALLALYMLVGVWNNTTGFNATIEMMEKQIGLPMPRVLLPIVIVYEVVSAVALFFPQSAMYSALVLALFCITAASLAHPWWKMPASFEQFLHKNLWFGNLAIAGAFLVLAFTPI